MAKGANHGAINSLNERVNLIGILKGVIFSYLITIPILIIFALFLSYTDFPERLISPAVVITTVVSVLIAGYSVTRGVTSKGWLNGAVVGFVYMLILYLLGSIFFENYTINKYVITMMIIGILTGAIGGMLGINNRSRSRTRGIYRKR